MNRKITRIVISVIYIFFVLLGFALLVKPRQSIVLNFLLPLVHRLPTPHVLLAIRIGGGVLFCVALLGLAWVWIAAFRAKSVDLLRRMGMPTMGEIRARLAKTFELGIAEAPMSHGKKINAWDITIIAVFLLFSISYLQNNLITYGYPLTLLDGDAANIASFAAAFDHPAIFQGDELLSDLNNIRIYNTVHIPLIRWFKQMVGNYGLAFQVMLAPTIFLQLLAFYFLGRVWFDRRYWAFLFSAINIIPVSTVVQEGWGIFNSPLPRFTFQALIPVILALVWLWRDRPLRWPLIMVFSGLLVYVHPVSTLAWLAAIWLGFWILLPAGWPVGKRLALMAGLVLAATLAILPFALNYLSYHVQGKIVNYDLLMLVLTNYFPPNILNVPIVVAQFLLNSLLNGLLPLSIAGFFVIRHFTKSEPQKGRLVWIWMAGIFLVSLVVPLAERGIERIFHLAPLETELVRGIRYFIFFMLFIIFWALVEWSKKLKNPSAVNIVKACGLVLIVFYSLATPGTGISLAPGLSCLAQGKFICKTSVSSQQVEQLVAAIKSNVPQGAKIYYSRQAFDSNNVFIRYLAERPLVYSFKDRGLLAYSNPVQLGYWYKNFTQVSQYKNDVLWLQKDPQVFLKFLKDQGVDYFVLGALPNWAKLTTSLDIVYQNDAYTLIDLRNMNAPDTILKILP